MKATSKGIRTWPAVLAATLLPAGCSSLDKPELERRLRELGKNAAVDSLERLTFTADLGDGPRELVLVHHRAPAREPSGRTPVVLVHGTPSTLFSWAEIVHGGAGFEGLAATRDVIAIEVIGHGIAPGDVAPYGFERCARFVAAALEALELERAFLVGSSYGGEFVWRAALNAPERVAGLVLIDSSGVERREEDWLPEEELMRDSSLAKLGWMLNSRERIASALAPHFRELPSDRVEEFFLVCENAANWKAMIDLARDENGDREGELARLETPVLLLWGAEDIAYPAEHYAARFDALLPDAELAILPATGHYPHEERPEETVRHIGRFLDAREPDR